MFDPDMRIPKGGFQKKEKSASNSVVACNDRILNALREEIDMIKQRETKVVERRRRIM